MLPTIVKAKLYVKIKERKLNLQRNSNTEFFYVYYAYLDTCLFEIHTIQIIPNKSNFSCALTGTQSFGFWI